MKLLRFPAVCDKTGLPPSTVYRLAANGRFPKPIKLSERASAWRSDLIDEWIMARIEESA